MKTLNQLISDYTCNLKQGEVQIAYKVIMEFISKLRGNFVKRYPDCDISSIYQGYMDMSYFSISSELLKQKGLKIAIVYLHEKGYFEVWLSARNREISKQYYSEFHDKIFDGITIFHDINNQDAIIESALTLSPNFEEQELLTDIIVQGVEQFITTVNNHLTR